MSEAFDFTIESGDLLKGLRRSKRSPRDAKFLVKSDGVRGRNTSLVVLNGLTRIDTSIIADGFPYPQVFAFANFTVICGKYNIYEYTATLGLSFKYTVSLIEGLWTAVDYYRYLYLSNGEIVVIRNADSGEYSLDTTGLPATIAACNFNGQMLVS